MLRKQKRVSDGRIRAFVFMLPHSLIHKELFTYGKNIDNLIFFGV